MEESQKYSQEQESENNTNYYKYILIIILIFSFWVNLYYFSLTKEQPLWWDEAEYMSTAKSWAYDIPYKIAPERPPLFPLLGAIVLKLGFSDLIFKFLFVLIPSLLNVFVIYLLGKELFNKNVGLIAAFIMAVFWSLIFWTARYHPDSLVLLFQLLAIYFFWLGFIKSDVKNRIKFSILTGLFCGLAFLVKLQALIIFPIFGIMIIISQRFSFLKKKEFWLSTIVFFITILPYLIWNYFRYGNFLAFAPSYAGSATSEAPFAWNMLNFLLIFTEWPFFILFLIGVIITLFNLFIGLDIFIKNKNENFVADLLLIITIIIVLAFFIFVIKIPTAEERWLYLMAPFIFLFAAKTCNIIYEKIKKYNKLVGVVILVLILGSGAYIHLEHADQIINIKKETYLQVKQAALWMKENTNEKDKIFSISFPQTQYYSNRQTLSYWPWHSGYHNVSEFADWLNREKPKYLTVSIFENHPDWIQPFIQNNSNKFIPAQAYFLDTEQKQVALVVYEIKY